MVMWTEVGVVFSVSYGILDDGGSDGRDMCYYRIGEEFKFIIMTVT